MAADRSQSAGSTDYVVRFSRGAYVFREGDPGDAMYIIQEGEIEILQKSGRSEVRLALLEEGDFFGEMAILEDQPRVASARAANECALLRIDASTFDQMARHNPEIPVRMLRKLSARLRRLGEITDPASAEYKPVAAPETETPAQPPESAKAALIHGDSNTTFTVNPEGETTIGRIDPATGFKPHIELKPIDTQRSTSRRHARIVAREGRHFVREEIGVANGTFVNGQRIATGVEVELDNGDEVSFGLVKLTFRVT